MPQEMGNAHPRYICPSIARVGAHRGGGAAGRLGTAVRLAARAAVQRALLGCRAVEAVAQVVGGGPPQAPIHHNARILGAALQQLHACVLDLRVCAGVWPDRTTVGKINRVNAILCACGGWM